MTNYVGTCGTFDYLIHEGHLDILKLCQSIGKVAVFLTDDDTVKRLKGRSPYYTQEERAVGLKRTGLVQHVIPLDSRHDAYQQINSILDYSILMTHYVFGPDQLTDFDFALRERLVAAQVYCLRSLQGETVHTTELLKRDGLL